MSEIKVEDLGDSIIVSDLIGYYVNYDSQDFLLDFQKEYRHEADKYLNTINFLPLLFDKLLVDELPGFPEERFNDFIEAEIIATPVYTLDKQYSLPYSKFLDTMNKDNREKVENLNILRVNVENLDIIDPLFQQDESDLDYGGKIAEKILTEWGPLEEEEFKKAISLFMNSINFDIINSHFFKLPIFTKQTHTEIWGHKFNGLFNEIKTFGKEYKIKEKIPGLTENIKKIESIEILKSFLSNVEISYPSTLEIDDLIAFRKDKARKNFKDWLFSYVEKVEEEVIINLDENNNIKDEMVKDFNELSMSMNEKKNERANLLNASLTGLSTSLASLFNPILALPVAVSSPLLLNKPTLALFVKLMKKYSANNWVLFFSEFSKKDK